MPSAPAVAQFQLWVMKQTNILCCSQFLAHEYCLSQVLSNEIQCMTGLYFSKLCYAFCFLLHWWINCWRVIHCSLPLLKSKCLFLFLGSSSIIESVYNNSMPYWLNLQNSILLCFYIIKITIFVTKLQRRLYC